MVLFLPLLLVMMSWDAIGPRTTKKQDKIHKMYSFEHLVQQLAICMHATATTDAKYWQQRQANKPELRHP